MRYALVDVYRKVIRLCHELLVIELGRVHHILDQLLMKHSYGMNDVIKVVVVLHRFVRFQEVLHELLLCYLVLHVISTTLQSDCSEVVSELSRFAELLIEIGKVPRIRVMM